MDYSQSESGSSNMVLVPTQHTVSRQIPVTDRLVKMSGPVALKPDETAFVEKTLHYISGIRGAVKTNLTLSTNTKYPSRYIIVIRGLPVVGMVEFDTILNTNERIRTMTVNMMEESIRIDVWRENACKTKRKKRRMKTQRHHVSCDMSNVEKRDQKCLYTFLQQLNAMENIDCQFTVNVDTSNPEFYNVDLHIMDSMCVKEMEEILHVSRSFCREIEFDFPHKLVRAKCLRLAVPLRRRRLVLKK
jgi:hypothetical protein